jgi:hypothetical protein
MVKQQEFLKGSSIFMKKFDITTTTSHFIIAFVIIKLKNYNEAQLLDKAKSSEAVVDSCKFE